MSAVEVNFTLPCFRPCLRQGCQVGTAGDTPPSALHLRTQRAVNARRHTCYAAAALCLKSV